MGIIARLPPHSLIGVHVSTITLLVVEDDPLIALDLEEALQEAGYACVLAHTGSAAIAELEGGVARVAGLLTDIRIGKGRDGWSVGRRARELVSNVPVIYMSGDSAGDWSSKGVPNSLMISKPYALAQVITAISQLITAASMANSAQGASET